MRRGGIVASGESAVI